MRGFRIEICWLLLSGSELCWSLETQAEAELPTTGDETLKVPTEGTSRALMELAANVARLGPRQSRLYIE